MRYTKIIATLGPSSSEPAQLAALIDAGVDIFRLNFSHGTHEEHATRIGLVRAAASHARRSVAILQDLSGPKIRTGRLPDGRALPIAPGEHLDIRIGDGMGAPGVVYTTYAPLAEAVTRGNRLLLDDGHIELQVEAVADGVISTTVMSGRTLGQFKGINAPGLPLPPAGLTARDEIDLVFGLAQGVDLVALSFVQSPADIEAARRITARERRPDVPIIAKLERSEALQHLEAILRAADGVMVARGDLGLEIPLQLVPRVQRQILSRARALAVPSILATQVLESMRVETRPTRAEVSDATTAVRQGADAIMLSGETAAGAHPVLAVQTLDTILREAERPDEGADAGHEVVDHAAALSDAAFTLATRAGADAIVAVTRLGRTAQLLSARRPPAPIVAVTGDEVVARRLSRWWGTRACVMPIDGHVDDVAPRVLSALVENGLLKEGATVVLVNISLTLDNGVSNFLRVRRASR
ncbi:MAG: pyruvate kinase [Acidobacteria bacterium]|nr:pyruvate kinase [Acidobacteriota bacterium]